MPNIDPKIQVLHLKLAYYDVAENYPQKENNGKLPAWGYQVGMSDQKAFELNRWDWNIDRKRNPKFVIFSYEGRVRFAVEITNIADIPSSRTSKKEIRGRVLDSNHPVYVEYVNKPTPEWGKGRGPRYRIR